MKFTRWHAINEGTMMAWWEAPVERLWGRGSILVAPLGLHLVLRWVRALWRTLRGLPLTTYQLGYEHGRFDGHGDAMRWG